jgi:hypothetical protein
MMATLSENIAKLKTLLPVIKEKEAAGLILPSYSKAQDLVRWHEIGKHMSDKQELFVGRLILRAERKHKGGKGVTVNTIQSVDVDAVAKQVLEKIGEQTVDTAAVADLVIKRLDARKPVEKIIVIQQPDGKKGKVKGPTHSQWEHLARAASVRLPSGHAPGIFLKGEASSGKTTGARQLAEAMKLKWHFNGAISFPHEMLGFIDGAGKYHRTPFREAYEHGGVYTFDEVDRCDPVALLAVNPHLANGVATFPDKQVVRHKDCIITATANTWGLGADANYSGATKLDAAFLSRFPVRISWDIDPVLEEAIVPNLEWLNVVRVARMKARQYGLKVMIDTRIAQAGASLIAAGYTTAEAAEMTYLANLKPDQRTQLQ